MSLDLSTLKLPALRAHARRLEKEAAELRSWARTETERADAAEKRLEEMVAGLRKDAP